LKITDRLKDMYIVLDRWSSSTRCR